MSQLGRIFERQGLHALLLAALGVGVYAASGLEQVRAGEFRGVETLGWYWIALAVPVLHQGYVWFCWRTELHASLLSRVLGRAGFVVYAVGFSILGISRGVIVLLAVSNRDTLPLDHGLSRTIALLLAIPSIYLFYSVQRHFGLRRAFGIDHFDPAYREFPMVHDGIFRFTANGMYTFGFLLLWIPGFWFSSVAALAVALFSHFYIWVHYVCTERPDMRRIYG